MQDTAPAIDAETAKLAQAFPELAAAVLMAKNDPDGIAYLQAIARGEVAA